MFRSLYLQSIGFAVIGSCEIGSQTHQNKAKIQKIFNSEVIYESILRFANTLISVCCLKIKNTLDFGATATTCKEWNRIYSQIILLENSKYLVPILIRFASDIAFTRREIAHTKQNKNSHLK